MSPYIITTAPSFFGLKEEKGAQVGHDEVYYGNYVLITGKCFLSNTAYDAMSSVMSHLYIVTAMNKPPGLL